MAGSGFDACVEAKIKAGMGHQEAMEACRVINNKETSKKMAVQEHGKHEAEFI